MDEVVYLEGSEATKECIKKCELEESEATKEGTKYLVYLEGSEATKEWTKKCESELFVPYSAKYFEYPIIELPPPKAKA